MSLGQVVTVELGGKTRSLIYDFNALVDLEEKLDLPIIDLIQHLTGSVRLKDLRNILLVGLRHDDPELTAEQVGAMITDVKHFEVIGKSVKAALEAAFPPPEKKTGKQRKN